MLRRFSTPTPSTGLSLLYNSGTSTPLPVSLSSLQPQSPASVSVFPYHPTVRHPHILFHLGLLQLYLLVLLRRRRSWSWPLHPSKHFRAATGEPHPCLTQLILELLKRSIVRTTRRGGDTPIHYRYRTSPQLPHLNYLRSTKQSLTKQAPHSTTHTCPTHTTCATTVTSVHRCHTTTNVRLQQSPIASLVPRHHPLPHLPRSFPAFMAPAIMCFGRKSDDPRSKKSEDIDKSLRAAKKRQEREVKLLLLGMVDVCSERWGRELMCE